MSDDGLGRDLGPETHQKRSHCRRDDDPEDQAEVEQVLVHRPEPGRRPQAGNDERADAHNGCGGVVARLSRSELPHRGQRPGTSGQQHHHPRHPAPLVATVCHGRPEDQGPDAQAAEHREDPARRPQGRIDGARLGAKHQQPPGRAEHRRADRRPHGVRRPERPRHRDRHRAREQGGQLRRTTGQVGRLRRYAEAKGRPHRRDHGSQRERHEGPTDPGSRLLSTSAPPVAARNGHPRRSSVAGGSWGRSEASPATPALAANSTPATRTSTDRPGAAMLVSATDSATSSAWTRVGLVGSSADTSGPPRDGTGQLGTRGDAGNWCAGHRHDDGEIHDPDEPGTEKGRLSMSTSISTPRTVQLPSARVLVGGVYVVCVLGTIAVFTGQIVFTDRDPHRNDGPVESIIAISTFGTAALVVGVGLLLLLAHTPERARIGAFVLLALAVVTVAFFWSGTPGILGACAAACAGLTRGGRPLTGGARAAGIVGAFIALLNVVLTIGGVVISPFG